MRNIAGASLIVAAFAGQMPLTAAAQADLYVRDTPADNGTQPNPDTGPMWVSEDIWVRTSPDPNHRPVPFDPASPPWTPAAHQSPEYRDPQYGIPNYVYVRVRTVVRPRRAAAKPEAVLGEGVDGPGMARKLGGRQPSMTTARSVKSNSSSRRTNASTRRWYRQARWGRLHSRSPCRYPVRNIAWCRCGRPTTAAR